MLEIFKKLKAHEKRALAVLGILFVAYTIVIFALPFKMNGVFWLSYLFAIISIAVQGYALYAGFVKGDRQRSKLYGFPIARIGSVYMIAQLVLSLLFMALAAILPPWVAIIISVIMLATAGIGLITTDAMREEIERQDAVLKKDVSLMRGLQSKARSIAAMCDDKDITPELEKFAEDMQYSDPVTSEALTDIEAELSALIDEMQKACVEADYCVASDICKKATVVLNKRNRLCKLNK